MAIAPERSGIGIRRHFSTAGVHPYDTVVWERRDARITNWRTGEVAFEQLGVEVPSTWSVNATNILAQKYFRGTLGLPEREWSLKQVADRVADTITVWGRQGGYFVDDEEGEVFNAELKHLIVRQMGAFNSPVWFNIGVKGVPQQGSACFILEVDDQMDSILNWYREEGVIFKGGSGAGVNLSKIRSSKEFLNGGGTASGPVSFMRGADASAGTIKSGGKTRRAAKMVILNADHPDIEDFLWCKAIEERKARVLRDAGFDMDLDGKDAISIQYQNANNSMRVTDDFMNAVVDDADWHLRAVADGQVVQTVRARELFRQFAEAAWECADPGMQYDTTINRWHTAPNSGRINGSNPCSEYMHVDNSACNLASINLMKFLNDDDSFDVAGFTQAVSLLITAQEIIVGNGDYPTAKIAENSHRFRQLGLGYANIGALLMARGKAYDSDDGRALAASITALMTGHAYATSARIAKKMGPFAGYLENRDAMNNVLEMHRAEVAKIDEEITDHDVLFAAQEAWDSACELGAAYGVRNAQASVLAPTGTIGLLMDCDTTGVEPDLGLVKFKKMVGGGSMQIVNQTVPRALKNLGYRPKEIESIVAYIDVNKTIVGAPELRVEHLSVFACSMGDNVIHYLGHVKMMGAVQPFISGAISKTVNMPEDATVDEVAQLHIDAWKLGIKAIAIYRDNCKVGQPLQTAKKDGSERNVFGAVSVEPDPALTAKIAELEQALASTTTVIRKPQRERLARKRRSNTFEFRVADCSGFVTVGEYDDGRPGEVFINMSKQGSTLAGIMDAFSISISFGLQHGVPLATYVRKFSGMRFEPAGITDDAELRIATSVIDYIFRRLALDYLPLDVRTELGVLSAKERTQPTLPGVEEAITTSTPLSNAGTTIADSIVILDKPTVPAESTRTPGLLSRGRPADAPFCYSCGNEMNRAGSCYVCSACGATSGCS